MKRRIISAASAAIVAACAIGAQAATPKDSATQAMVDIFGHKDVTAVDRYFASPYKQHNMGVPDGLEALRTLSKGMTTRPAVRTTIYRAIADKDIVVLHSVYDGFTLAGGKPMAAFDMFRFKNGKIVEHWDALAPMAALNPSGHSLVDGPGAITDRSRTEANRAVVRNFVQTVFVGGQFDRAGEFIDADHYTQHNSMIGDGLASFKAAFAGMAKTGMKLDYKPHQFIAEGNFVLVQAEGMGGAMAIYDLFRLEKGKIVEHWDILQPVPPRDKWKNPNGPF